MKKIIRFNLVATIVALVLSACSSTLSPQEGDVRVTPQPESETAESPHESPMDDHMAGQTEVPEGEPDYTYTLVTNSGEDGLALVGRGSEIEGVRNPTLHADPGNIVEITLVNGDGVLHDLTVEAFGVMTEHLEAQDEESTLIFQVGEAGEFEYFCSIPGHREAGMLGTLHVGPFDEPGADSSAQGVSVVRNPADVPPPVGSREPITVRIDLTAREVTGQLTDGTTYDYFTFDGQIPGPMIRVRVGDTVEVHLKNEVSSQYAHSIDLHAAIGPGVAQSPPRRSLAKRPPSASRRLIQDCMSITAPRRAWPITSPAACTG